MKNHVIKNIFRDNWTAFSKLYSARIRKVIFNEIDKILSCGHLKKGYVEFECPDCKRNIKVGFSCKSRFCTSCGKIYVDNRVDELMGKLIKTRHRHMVFTIPEELRECFQRDRKLLALLPNCAAKVIKSWMHELNKGESFVPGIVAVIHTFGRDLKWNPHAHVLVTEGGAGKNIVWRNINYFHYEALRKR